MENPLPQRDADAGSPLPSGPLDPQHLLRRSTVASLGFATTDDLADVDEILGQPRAVEAIGFGIGMREDGYNLFAMGPEGLGRRSIARRFLERAARGSAVPQDWCYVFDFGAPHRPRAIALPPGRGATFRRDMERLLDDLRAGIPAAFEADEYRTRKQEIENELSERQERAIQAVGEHAAMQKIGLLRTPGGFGFAPLEGDDVMPPDKYHALPEEEQKRIQGAIEALQAELQRAIESAPTWRREAQHKLRDLDRQVTRGAINVLIEELKAAYRDLPAVERYLKDVQEDVLDHAQLFLQPKEAESGGLMGLVLSRMESADGPLRRYAVNLLVDHGGGTGAPMVYEDNPTHDNLVGRIEHVSHMGAVTTDFTLIKAGALHRANGGYLIVDALKLLTQPFAWEALKRALRSREIQTEPLAHALGLLSTQSLEPEPIPLDVKVVLVGQRELYYLLHAFDPEFARLFKVAVDFDEDMPRDAGAELLYARLVAGMVKRAALRPFDRAAVARVIEHASRLAGDGERLSVEMSPLRTLLEESNYWAGCAGRDVVAAGDVQQAIEARLRRADRLPSRVRDEMLRGRLMIATGGERVGQVNGLSVAELAGVRVGIPVRITARVRLGGGGVVDIERESELGGRIHSKGVLILAGYLAAHYAPRLPLSLAATLVFEQTYGGVEGDSASSAELYALLSALADAPIRQSLAVTGSVNQHGDVQAVGAVNEKVEGFFDLCKERGLDGSHGAIVPLANVGQLMLRADLVEAVAAGRFAVHAVRTVDEGLAVLTGLPAAPRDALGAFPAGSLNARIEQRLADFAERARAFAVPRHSVRRRRRGDE
jgi:lon-related putative ATP-dependent protease